MRIAILEDDPSLRELICDWLTVAGHQVHALEQGELLAIIQDTNFDALLLDWNVPEPTGIDLLKQLREHNGRLPWFVRVQRAMRLAGGDEDRLRIQP
jgi:DNA-binding response OmpR family regulator